MNIESGPAVPNDDTGHEWAARHHLFIYEVDFGEEGKGRYIRLSDFNKVCEKLERAAQAMPEDMCLVTKEDGNNYCLILTALGMEEEGDPVAEVKRLAAADAAQAVSMLLYCPMCGSQHIDAPGQTTDWDNPPHRSHLCHSCGCIWRPADVATVGVAAIETKGLADTFDVSKGRELPRDDAQAVPEGTFSEPLESQIDRLAKFIIDEVPGEPAQSQGAIDTAIRWMRESMFNKTLPWAVEQWHKQVKDRPLRNIHRRALDDVWRQVIRHEGGDDIALCGPTHDDMLAERGISE